MIETSGYTSHYPSDMPDRLAHYKLKCRAGQFVTFKDELDIGLYVSPKVHDIMEEFYEDIDLEWFERKFTPLWFDSEFDLYEWLFKRAMAGYSFSAHDHMIVAEFELTNQYDLLAYRYERLKIVFADELKHVFGTLKGYRQ
jgi:hypothetical protein